MYTVHLCCSDLGENLFLFVVIEFCLFNFLTIIGNFCCKHYDNTSSCLDKSDRDLAGQPKNNFLTDSSFRFVTNHKEQSK
jgi:hypothetical protein